MGRRFYLVKSSECNIENLSINKVCLQLDLISVHTTVFLSLEKLALLMSEVSKMNGATSGCFYSL